MKKILIVDDDEHVRAFVKALFVREDFITTDASCGVSAIKNFESNQPDVVIIDHDMPHMSGVEVLKELKKIAPDLPVVMFTGSGNEALGEAAIRAGASDFIRKPADNNVIIAAVQKALGSSGIPMDHRTA
ncbi:MAG: response regulator [Nitrospirae bacterium]|nr:response regulator [Nitrospirota bacterium]